MRIRPTITDGVCSAPGSINALACAIGSEHRWRPKNLAIDCPIVIEYIPCTREGAFEILVKDNCSRSGWLIRQLKRCSRLSLKLLRYFRR